MFADHPLGQYGGYNPAFVKAVLAKRDAPAPAPIPVERKPDVIDTMLKRAVEKYGRVVTPREKLRIDIEAVARVYGLSHADLVSKSQTHLITTARSAAMWMLKFTRNMTLPEIGRYFGMDHTAVLAGINRHVARIDPSDPRAEWAERKRVAARKSTAWYERKTDRPYRRKAA